MILNSIPRIDSTCASIADENFLSRCFSRPSDISSEEILNYFYNRQTIIITPDGLRRKVDLKLLVGTAAPADIFVEGTDDVLVRKNKKITRAALKRLGDRDIAPLVMKKEELAGKVARAGHHR